MHPLHHTATMPTLIKIFGFVTQECNDIFSTDNTKRWCNNNISGLDLVVLVSHIVLSEVRVCQVEAISGSGQGGTGDAGAPLVGTLPTAPLVVREPQSLAQTLPPVYPQRGLLYPPVLSELCLGSPLREQ